MPELDFSEVEVRNHRLSAEELAGLSDYKRFEIMDSGGDPGLSEKLVLVDSDEHDEYGWITEDLAIRVAMMEKHLRKGESLAQEISPPLIYPGGDFRGKAVLLGWGSSFGPLKEAVDRLNRGPPLAD